MTYNDIYKKFLIEYDKADVSSSYPPLTNEEIAAILNKAMYALIAQKVTGNNPRKVALDMDSKAMSDIAPLIKYFDTVQLPKETQIDIQLPQVAKNEFLFKFDSEEPAYLLSGVVKYADDNIETADLLTSVISDKFKETAHNKPWIKNPIMYMQTIDDYKVMHVLVDSNKTNIVSSLYIKGIYMPDRFKNEYTEVSNFPLSDTVCEELINLAIIFACRNVQDPRLATVVQTKSLEA